MAQVEVRNLKNEVVETLSLDDEVFNYTASETLVWEAVNAYLAGQRKGTHATKTRGLVSGSGRKLWRQKGTGRARVGEIRSPVWRKGGTVFGPQPRDYSQSFPKKKRRGALKVVLSDKLKNEKLRVIDSLELETHRTQDFLEVLRRLEIEGGKVLVVDGRENRNLFLGSRNLPGVKMVPALGLNIYDLMRHEHLVISKQAVLSLQEVLKK